MDVGASPALAFPPLLAMSATMPAPIKYHATHDVVSEVKRKSDGMSEGERDRARRAADEPMGMHASCHPVGRVDVSSVIVSDSGANKTVGDTAAAAVSPMARANNLATGS